MSKERSINMFLLDGNATGESKMHDAKLDRYRIQNSKKSIRYVF